MRFRILLAATAGAAVLLVTAAGPAAAAPANDSWEGALELRAPDLYIQDTQDATPNADEQGLTEGACGWSQQPKGSVWYKYPATQTGTFVVDAAFSDYQVNLVVVTREGDAWATPACFQTKATFTATAGKTYYVLAVAADGSNAGSLQLATSHGAVAWVDAYETGGRINTRGDAVLKGALFCGTGSVYTLKVQAEQRDGGAPVVGVGSKVGTCTGAETAWTVVADAPRRFKPGEALVTAELIVCDQTSCQTVDSRAYTQLTR